MKSTKTKIAVNARFLLKNRLQGIGRFSHEVLNRLVHIMPDCEFHFAFDRPFHKDFIYADNVTGHVLKPPARHPILWYLFFEHSMRKWLKKGEFDVFFSPDSFLCLETGVPTLLVMHDLAYEHYPEHVSPLTRKYYQRYFPKYAEKADHIAAVSEFTKADIISKYGIQQEKISVAYNGISSLFRPHSAIENELTRKEYSDSKPFFVFVGSLNPRKNLTRVLQAFEEFKKDHAEVKLLLIGAEGWKNTAFMKALESSKHRTDIKLTGHVTEKELARLTSAADALLFPSLFEGFGIPIIEAFASATAVITSDVASMPEVAGNAAILVNPKEPDEITQAMNRMMDETTRKDLVQRGIDRAKQFGWDITAEKLAAQLRRLVE